MENGDIITFRCLILIIKESKGKCVKALCDISVYDGILFARKNDEGM